jgi:hypothetical protein
MEDATHTVSTVIELEIAEMTVMGLLGVIKAELGMLRVQMPYADRLFLRLEWTGPSEEIPK